jgi:hypothetical protein
MSTNTNAVAAGGDLQFDRVAPALPSVTCAKCSRAVTTYYYVVDDTSICSSCKRALDAEWSLRKTGLLRAAGYGAGAAVVGAIIYYGVIAITNLEIGIVALAIGHLVGRAVRSGAGRGGRRFQVLAAALTYLSVGMAYTPLVLKPIMRGGAAALLTKGHGVSTSAREKPAAPADSVFSAADQSADSSGVAAPAPAPTTAARPASRARPKRMTFGLLAMGLASTALFVTILPIIAVLGSLPFGLITALIIGIGMRRAWRMTADTGTASGTTTISGPFRLGKAAAVASA